ncbi:MAG: aminotransferase class I/II-fold pyridoxal phosphate-dependent enzyme [Bacillota bacterium]|nr:aminotransferase class I/II-fold pyridoxal phosphate-dependent enzyme [Bacillota bacterium]
MRIPPFGVERWFVQYEFKVSHNIAESCIQPFTIRELCELCGSDPAEFLDTRVGYADGLGGIELREAIAALYPDTGPDNVLVTTGAIEANFLVAQALLRPGDRAVVEFPAYQQLYSVPASTGAEVRLWELHEDRGYRPDFDWLESLAPKGEKLRLLTVNHPHNPSGAGLDADGMSRLVAMTEARGAYLHSDEVYRGLTLDQGTVPTPSAREFSDRAIVVGSMSKAWGLSGARIGWIAGPADVVRRCGEIRDYVSICPSACGERLALMALRNGGPVMDRNRRLARRNFALLRGFLERNSDILACPLPAEGVVAFPSYAVAASPGRLLASRALCGRLADQHGVLLVPGECFEREYHFRIGFGYETRILEEGLESLERFLRCLLSGQ